MTDETLRMIIVAAVSAVPPTIAATAAMVVALKSKQQIHELHMQVNSRMDELLRVSMTAARAEGVEAQRTKEGV